MAHTVAEQGAGRYACWYSARSDLFTGSGTKPMERLSRCVYPPQVTEYRNCPHNGCGNPETKGLNHILRTWSCSPLPSKGAVSAWVAGTCFGWQYLNVYIGHLGCSDDPRLKFPLCLPGLHWSLPSPLPFSSTYKCG